MEAAEAAAAEASAAHSAMAAAQAKAMAAEAAEMAAEAAGMAALADAAAKEAAADAADAAAAAAALAAAGEAELGEAEAGEATTASGKRVTLQLSDGAERGGLRGLLGGGDAGTGDDGAGRSTGGRRTVEDDGRWRFVKMTPPPLPGTQQPLLPSTLPSPRTFLLPQDDPHRRVYGLRNAPPLRPRPPQRAGGRASPRASRGNLQHAQGGGSLSARSPPSGRLLSPRGFTRGGQAAEAPWQDQEAEARRLSPRALLAPLPPKPGWTAGLEYSPAGDGGGAEAYLLTYRAPSPPASPDSEWPWPKVWPARDPATQRERPVATSAKHAALHHPHPHPHHHGTPGHYQHSRSRRSLASSPPTVPMNAISGGEEDDRRVLSLWAEAGGRFYAYGEIN
jgi:hypothetical protein